VKATLVVTELSMTCDACPVQFEGRVDDGRYVYIRSRHGGLRVGVGPTLKAAVGAGEFWGAEDTTGTEVLLDVDVDEFATPDEVLSVIAASGVLSLPEAPVALSEKERQ
jgi:hypothetical protein